MDNTFNFAFNFYLSMHHVTKLEPFQIGCLNMTMFTNIKLTQTISGFKRLLRNKMIFTY